MPASRIHRMKGCCHAWPALSYDLGADGDILYVMVPITWLRSPQGQPQGIAPTLYVPGNLKGLPLPYTIYSLWVAPASFVGAAGGGVFSAPVDGVGPCS